MVTATAAYSKGSKAQTTASAASFRNIGNVGIRLFGGRVFFPYTITNGNTTGTTFEVLMTTALDFDAVRIIYAAGNSVALAAITMNMNGAVCVVGDSTDTSIGAAAWTGITWGGTNNIGGSTPGTLAPAVSSDRRAFVLSDIIPIASIPRTDGGKFPLLCVRTYLYQASGADGYAVISGNGAQTFANWGTHPSGRIWRMSNKGGGWATSGQSSMTFANSNQSAYGSPIAGVVYYSRGKVVNVVGVGDSITEGQGTYIGEGFGFPACLNLTTGATNGVAYEWSDLGWAGCTSSQMRQNLIDGLSTGLRWDVAVLPNGSPNDIGTTVGNIGSISGNTLTVTNASAGTITVNNNVYINGTTPGTYITAQGTGTGGLGTYSVNISQNVASGTLTTSAPITSTIIGQQRFKTGHMLDLLHQNGITPVVWTYLPTNQAVHVYGSSDSLRIGLNNDTKGSASHGAIVCDFSSAIAGATDAVGQISIQAGMTGDGIHPNDSGNALLVPILQKGIQKAVAPGTGQVY